MLTPAPRISLADLTAAGIRLRPIEAVTVARELIVRAGRGALPGIPSAHVVRFTTDGEILIEGPVAAGRSVERAARLLEAMLPGFDAPPEFRVPGALRLVLARAAGTLDVPAYATLEAFADALARFAATDSAAIVRDVAAGWNTAIREAEAVGSSEAVDVNTTSGIREEITVSDLRRARRATGLSLAEIADRSRIPVSLLRELEWGYFVNWPSGQYGRTQLVRYARAAGLDDEVVIRAVQPELAAAGRTLDGGSWQEPASEPVNTSLVPIERSAAIAVPADVSPRRRSPWLAALAIPALVAIGLVPAMWNAADERDPAPPAVVTAAPAPRDVPVEPAAERAAPASAVTNPVAAAPAPTAAPVPSIPDTRPSSTDGRAPRPAALRANAAFSPAFASVGSAMFYHAAGDSGSAIMRADTDGEGAVLRITRVVDDNSQNFHARPSPDGSQIAFDSDRDGERAVYVADASGRNVRRITGEGFAAVPSWSPDGRQIAYVRAEEGRPRVWNLWTVDLQNGETRRLTSHRVGQPWGAAWFPDGGSIAYSHEDRLVVRSVEAGQQRIYPSPRKGRLLRTPAVSPDGRRIIFQVYRDGAWLLDLSDGSMRKILSDPTAEEFTWSPDGKQVAYHSRQTGKWGVWIMAPR